MTAVEAARRWAFVWKHAWESLDAEGKVALYAPDAVMSSAPFRTPYRSTAGIRDYISKAFADEEDPHVHVGTPIVDGDRAAVTWWVSLVEDGEDTTIAGTSVLLFKDDGLVAEQWDTWNIVRERLEPPEMAAF